jgi:hypothetical protein
MYYRSNRGRLGKSFQPTVQPLTIPSSVGGVNALSPFTAMKPEEALYLFNAVPSEYGVRLRKGYREWATGVAGDVRTLIPYDSQGGVEDADRLFAVSENGIYNVTNFNTTAPAQEVAFTDQSEGAGYGVWTNFTTDAAENLVLYADEINGLHYYNGDTVTWYRPTITFPDATTIDDIAFIMTHKQRVWMVKRGGADAYYLAVDSVEGDAIKFNFGSKFEHGGTLRGLWSWTIDGGDGVDDFLIALGGGGDVLVYYGPDPSQQQWSLRGNYFIGQPPQARRISTSYGGDLYLLSSYGIVSVRDLLNGVDYSNVKVGPAGSITRFLRDGVQQEPASYQWALNVHPRDGFLQIITPLRDISQGDTRHRQYVMNLLTQAWGWWRDVPMICSANQLGEYFIGGPDGVVYIYDGALDNTRLNGTVGDPIEFGGLTSFQPYGNHGQYMRPSFIRAVGLSGGVVALNVKAVFDYEVNENIIQPPPNSRGSGSVWDTDLWDSGTWDFLFGGAATPIGASGLGRTMAVGYRGSSESRITITAWDVMYTAGGLL